MVTFQKALKKLQVRRDKYIKLYKRFPTCLTYRNKIIQFSEKIYSLYRKYNKEFLDYK